MNLKFEETQPVWFKQGGCEGVGYIRGMTLHTSKVGTKDYWIVELVKIVSEYRDTTHPYSCMIISGANINAVSQAYIHAWVSMQENLDKLRPEKPINECMCEPI